MKYIILFLLVLCGSINMWSQQTVGLFTYEAGTMDGYTLFAPIQSTQTYLINNCGEKVHTWTSDDRPGLSVYLLDNGNLLRTINTNNAYFTAGGSGGALEILDWDSNLIWSYTLSDTQYCLHHDVEPLPNGNILAIVWESIPQTEVEANGKMHVTGNLWAGKIIEIKPDFNTGGSEIVWEWRVWDHLVQEVDASKLNYGSVADAPHQVNINYPATGPARGDWLHLNGIDYNAQLDQILLSTRRFNEMWVIDHSTTTQEASSNMGGNAGRGGDLLFRWGNPAAYNQGNADDQVLYGQHDANWILFDHPGQAQIMVFNNQAGTAEGLEYSSVMVIDPPIHVDIVGMYPLIDGVFFLGEEPWIYTAEDPTDFYSQNISGAHRLKNGNIFITEGATGRFFEINNQKELVWEYINPAGRRIIEQEAPATQNSVFRATKYRYDFPAFIGKELIPQGYIENGSTFECELILANKELFSPSAIKLAPQPAKQFVMVQTDESIKQIWIYDLSGKLISMHVPTAASNNHEVEMDCKHLRAGLYFLHIQLTSGQRLAQKLLIE